jgi:hypothetical protein
MTPLLRQSKSMKAMTVMIFQKMRMEEAVLPWEVTDAKRNLV